MDRNRTDEPDDTPAYEASLRPPGGSVRPTQAAETTDEEIAPDAAPEGDDPTLQPPEGAQQSRAGYDVDAVAGDTEIYRPD